MNSQEINAALTHLLQAYGGAKQNPGSYMSERCVGSIHCMFSTNCDNCYRCTHCQDCQATTVSSHCVRCVGCHGCSHCEDTQHSTESAYLIRCSFCNDCNYCFACVGLQKKEFHILNQPYSRNEYFAFLKGLRGK